MKNSGEYDADINFTFDFSWEVHGSCAATLNNEMYLFGGGGGVGSAGQDKVNFWWEGEIAELSLNFKL